MSQPSRSLTNASLEDENLMLQQELNKVEDLLSSARAERDEVIIKYNALSDRVIGYFYKFNQSADILWQKIFVLF